MFFGMKCFLSLKHTRRRRRSKGQHGKTINWHLKNSWRHEFLFFFFVFFNSINSIEFYQTPRHPREALKIETTHFQREFFFSFEEIFIMPSVYLFSKSIRTIQLYENIFVFFLKFSVQLWQLHLKSDVTCPTCNT